MRAAVIREFGAPPLVEDVPDPEPGEGRVRVRVEAAGQHQLVRARAEGRHYSVTGVLPTIPGVDGVGTLDDGRRVYFRSMEEGHGSFAEQVVVPESAVSELPEGSDPVAVAAGANPSLAAWMSLVERGAMRSGDRVVVLGATGSSGGLTLDVARLLDAGALTAVGRDVAALDRLAAADPDLETVPLGEDDPDAWARVLGAADIVVDFLWGQVAERAFAALEAAHRPPGHPLTYVQVGGMAGGDATVPAGILRSSDVRLLGSGLGSFTPEALDRELPRMLDELGRGRLSVPARAVPLEEVAEHWDDPGSPRVVVVPGE